MKKRIITLVCLFAISFVVIGYFYMERPHTITAVVESYNAESHTLVLCDSENEKWIFCNVSIDELSMDKEYQITYCKDYQLQSLHCDGQKINYL